MSVKPRRKTIKKSNSLSDFRNYPGQLQDGNDKVLWTLNNNATWNWCGGDGENTADSAKTVRELSDNNRFKDVLITELLRTNHDSRLKLADAENRIALMRLKIDAHCECCSKGLGQVENAERKKYTSDWSSECSTAHRQEFWSSKFSGRVVSEASLYSTRDEHLNPYIKVKRWQESYSKDAPRDTESSPTSTIALKRCARPTSPVDKYNYFSRPVSPELTEFQQSPGRASHTFLQQLDERKHSSFEDKESYYLSQNPKISSPNRQRFRIYSANSPEESPPIKRPGESSTYETASAHTYDSPRLFCHYDEYIRQSQHPFLGPTRNNDWGNFEPHFRAGSEYSGTSGRGIVGGLMEEKKINLY